MDSVINIIALRIDQRIRRCFTQSMLSRKYHCFKLIIEFSYKIGDTTNEVRIAVPFQLITSTIKLDEVKLSRLPMLEMNYNSSQTIGINELVESVYDIITKDYLLSDNYVLEKPFSMYIVEVAGSAMEYYRIMKATDDSFDPELVIDCWPDGLYRIFDPSNKKRINKNPPFYIFKRDGKYTMIDVDQNEDYTFIDDITPNAIVARAYLNFGGCYSMRRAHLK